MPRRTVATAILNPTTGRRSADEVEALLREVLSQHMQLTIVRTRRSGDSISLGRAAARQSDVVIAVGGDGTVSEVAYGMLGSKAHLAIIPTGSTNVIARSYNIPNEPRRAARALLGELDAKKIDVIRVENRIAIHMVGCGFDAQMMSDTVPTLKRAAAWVAYVPAAIKNVTGSPWEFTITIDGRTISTVAKMVLVANGAFVLDPRFEVGRNIRSDDGLLDVIVFTPPNLAATTEIASRLAIGRIDRSHYVQQFRGKRIRIESDPIAPVECDGDVVGMTPVEMEVLPAALTLLAPKSEATEPALTRSGVGAVAT
ncbi:MAG TPA: diacylglycerol kinase family protein [Nitrolancea sp.]|nr:diacylglycerol kinase family protein [Nitrolancea sp.]